MKVRAVLLLLSVALVLVFVSQGVPVAQDAPPAQGGRGRGAAPQGDDGRVEPVAAAASVAPDEPRRNETTCHRFEARKTR
jgi:hypothetical protein